MRWAPLLLLVASFGCGHEKEKRVDPAAGHALLAEYVETVQSMARGGALAELGPLLDQQIEEARRVACTRDPHDGVWRNLLLL